MLRWDGRARAVTLLAITAVYFAAGKLGLSLALVHASASAVWPPTGIALAAFLLLGRSVWPAIFAGAFLVNVTTAGSPATSLGIAVGNTLEAWAGAELVRRFAGGAAAFDRPRDVWRFFALAGLVATAISPTIGVTSLCLAGFASWSEYAAVWLTWWLGDIGGAVVVAPALVLWAQGPWPTLDARAVAGSRRVPGDPGRDRRDRLRRLPARAGWRRVPELPLPSARDLDGASGSGAGRPRPRC